MKYLILENNLKWDRNYENINYFYNETARDNFLEDLNTNFWLNLKNAVNHSINKDLGNVSISNFKVSYSSKDELLTKNTIAIQQKDMLYFYWIENVTDAGNSKIFYLDLEMNLFLTYWNITNNLKNFNLIKGNLPVEEYFNYEFDGGNWKVANQELFPKLNNNHNIWLFAYKKYNEDTDEVLENEFKTTKQQLIFNNQTILLDSQYKIYAAPLIPRTDNEIVYSADKLMNWANNLSDGTIYAIKLINYDFYNNSNIDIVHKPATGIYRFDTIGGNSYTPDDSNTEWNNNIYKINLAIDLNIKTYLELLTGISKYYLAIENVKDIDIDIKDIYNNNLTLKYEFTPSPTEAKDTYRILDNNYNKLPIDERYTYTNETELTLKTNQLNEYKANNPFNEFEYLSGIKNLFNPLTYLNKASLISSTSGAFTNIGRTAFNRMKLKHKMESVNYSGATTFLLNSSKAVNNLWIREREYIGDKRDKLIDSIYKEGIDIEGKYNIEKITDISRSKFNYLRIDNFIEANTLKDINIEILNEIDSYFKSGIRIWFTNEIKDYSTSWNDNGDELLNT